MPIKARIRAAYEKELAEYPDPRRLADYQAVLRGTFPAEKYPKAWRYPARGGPPGCAMAFSRAVREMNGEIRGAAGWVWLPCQVEKEKDR